LFASDFSGCQDCDYWRGIEQPRAYQKNVIDVKCQILLDKANAAAAEAAAQAAAEAEA